MGNTFPCNKWRKCWRGMMFHAMVLRTHQEQAGRHPNPREFVILFALLLKLKLPKHKAYKIRGSWTSFVCVCVCVFINRQLKTQHYSHFSWNSHFTLHLCNQVKSSLSSMRTQILTLTNTWSHDPFVLIRCRFQTGRKATTKTKRYTRLHNLLRRLASLSLSTND